MRKEIQLKFTKWLAGMIILLFFLFYSQTLFQQDTALGIFLIVGLGLGYIESRSEVGIASGYTDFFITGSRTRFYGLLILFGLGTLGAMWIHYQAAQNGAVLAKEATGSEAIIPGTDAVTPVNFGFILGSFLFGVGLTINKGCGLGTLRNIGQGHLRYLWTLFFLFVGTIPGQFVKYQIDQSAIHQYSTTLYLPDALGYLGTGFLVILLLFILAVTAQRYERNRRKEETYIKTEPQILPESEDSQSNSWLFAKIIEPLFTTSWSRLISAILITGLLLLTLSRTGEKMSVTQPLLYPAIRFFQMFGFSFEHPAFDQPLQLVENGLFNDTDTVQNFAIIFGAMIFSLTSINFSFNWSIKWREAGWHMLGGFLMGFGAVLASGCIVGALYSGIVNLSLSGWVVFASMSLGIFVTVQLLNGKISTIPEIK